MKVHVKDAKVRDIFYLYFADKKDLDVNLYQYDNDVIIDIGCYCYVGYMDMLVYSLAMDNLYKYDIY